MSSPASDNFLKIKRHVEHSIPGGFRLLVIVATSILYSTAVCMIDLHSVPSTQTYQTTAALSVSAVFGLLLIFRNNSAYERWWEARKLWGQLTNDSRNLAIKIDAFATHLSQDERLQFAELIASFAEALKSHLRGTRNLEGLKKFHIIDHNQHVPAAIVAYLYKRLKIMRSTGSITELEQMQIDTHARSFMDICGANERILKSPITTSYKLLLWFGLLLNLGWLPWLLAPMFHWNTLIIVVLSSYFTFGLEMLAEDVERPFDDAVNDLPLDQICTTIRRSVFELLIESSKTMVNQQD